jgi:hypothetical protein
MRIPDVNIPPKVWTYAFVTVIAVLVWAWAAGETRRQANMLVRVRLVAPATDQVSWGIEPNAAEVTVNVEGSRFALQSAQRAAEFPLEITLGSQGFPAAEGRISIPIASAIMNDERFAGSGADVVSTDPVNLDVQVDRIQRLTNVPILPVIRGVQTEGAPTVDPPTGTLLLPSRLVPADPASVRLEAVIDRANLGTLEPGQSVTVPVPITPFQSVLNDDAVQIVPPTAKVTFTVRSQTRTTTQPVRVQIAGPAEDSNEYIVEVEEADRILRDVSITADAELIRQIESGQAKVVAIVHLPTRDKELMVKSRPISYFVAVVQMADGSSQGRIVDCKINNEQAREIRLRITRRESDEAPLTDEPAPATE